MTSSFPWCGANTSTRKNLPNCRPHWKTPEMPRRKRNEHDSRARIRLAVQRVGADRTVCNFGSRTLAIDRESESEGSTLVLSRDLRPLSGCACPQHRLAHPPERGRKGISAAADSGERTAVPSLLGLEWELQGERVDHPVAWCENCSPYYLAGTFSLSANPLQPRHLSSSSPAQRCLADLSQRNRNGRLRDRAFTSC